MEDKQTLSALYQEAKMNAQKRGTVFRLPSPLDTIVRVYQNEPIAVSSALESSKMKVTTVPISAVVDEIVITVWARVIRGV